MLKRIVIAIVCLWALCGNAQPYLLVGTYTGGTSEGIYVYRFNSNTATANLLSSVKTSNPSYLAVSPNEQYVYAVNENTDSTNDFFTGGTITAFSFNHTKGTLKPINQQASQGKHPCYVTVSNNGKWVIAGNYSSGTFAVLPVKEKGQLSPSYQFIRYGGNGPNKLRQQSAHVHATVLTSNNNYLLVTDLGTDEVSVYKFNKNTGDLTSLSETSTTPGSGPRHLVLNRTNTFVYLTEELSGNVTVFSFRNGILKALQTISAHPKGYDGPIVSADIHLSPDGKFLYCSNRGGANNIAIFKVNAKDGLLSLVGHQSTLGLTPRNFNFDPSGNFLLVANQQSSNIVIFKVDKKTGLLTDTGNRIDVPNPVCIKWITARKR